MSKSILSQVKELIPPLTAGLHKGQAGESCCRHARRSNLTM